MMCSNKIMVGLVACLVLIMPPAHALSPTYESRSYQVGTYVNKAKFCKVEQKHIDEYVEIFHCIVQLSDMRQEAKKEQVKSFEKALQELPDLNGIDCDRVRHFIVSSNENKRSLGYITPEMKCGSDKFKIKQ
jgi:hypothetical protein